MSLHPTQTQSPIYVNYPLYRDSFGDSSKLITLITSNETNLKICSLERKSKSKWGPADFIKESFRNMSCFFVFGYLQVFLREVIASASLDAFAESSVAMKRAIVVSGMSHVMVKLFVSWVSWKVLPYSGKIALLFVLYTVAFLIITVANSPASRLVGVVLFTVGNAMPEKTFLSHGTFYGDVAVISFTGGGGLGAVLGAIYYSGMCVGFYSMRIALENEIEFEITGIKTLFHVPSPQPLIFS